MQNWNKTIQLQQLSFGKRKCYCIRSAVGLVPSTCTELAAVFLQVVGCMGRHLGKGTSENLKSWVTKYLQIWHNLMFCSLTEKKYEIGTVHLYFLSSWELFIFQRSDLLPSQRKDPKQMPGFDKSPLHIASILFFFLLLSLVSLTINTFEVTSHNWLSIQELVCFFYAFFHYQRHCNAFRRGKQLQHFWHLQQLDACDCQRLNETI